MPIRKIKLVEKEYYHVLNRGTEKRKIFNDQEDLERFFQCMHIFNSEELIGSIHEQGFKKEKQETKKLVNFVAYNLLPNHFHFILEQVSENGISKFMKKLQGGYSWHFNKKYKRVGSLFQGPFKAKHLNTNEYLLYASVYVNLNDKIKQQLSPLGDQVAKCNFLGKSSWDEFMGENNLNKICCSKDIILGQFNSKEDYKEFALNTLEIIKENKEKQKELE